MSKIFRPVFFLSLGTLLSKCFGLLRDVMLLACFGTSIYGAAFLFAFTLPNLFRRLLGEGALSSSFIPVFAQASKQGSNSFAKKFLNNFFTQFLLILGILLISIWIFLSIALFFSHSDRANLGLKLSYFLMPYMPIICVAAILNAALNVLGSYKAGAFSPVFLNLSFIGFLLVGKIYSIGLLYQCYLLCLAVTIGGLLQVVWPLCLLRKKLNWRPEFYLEKNDPKTRTVWKLFLPTMIGSAVYQINIFVTRGAAFFIDDSSLSIFYIASRFADFPLSIFAVSVTTVVLPTLALQIARSDFKNVTKTYQTGIILILSVLVPAARGIFVLSEPLLKLFFEWGRFSSQDISVTIPVLKILAFGMPFYGLASISTRAFHALQDTVTPLKVSALCLLINFFITCLTVLAGWKTVGLASAVIISVVVQAIMLQLILQKRKPAFTILPSIGKILRVIFSTEVMAATINFIIPQVLQYSSKRQILLSTTLVIIAGIIAYASVIFLIERHTFKLWISILRGKN